MQIKFNGMRHLLETRGMATVKDIKLAIQQSISSFTEASLDEQRLIHAGRQLEDSQVLAECGITEHDSILLLRSPILASNRYHPIHLSIRTFNNSVGFDFNKVPLSCTLDVLWRMIRALLPPQLNNVMIPRHARHASCGVVQRCAASCSVVQRRAASCSVVQRRAISDF